MGIKRIVDTSFWTDGKVDEFSPEDKYFMLYLLTNPFTTQLGIYEMSIKQAAFQMGYSVESVKVMIDRFENKYGMLLYDPVTNEVAIKNFLRHSIIKGGAPVRDCLIKEMRQVKSRHLIAEVFAHIKGYEGLNETVRNIITEYEKQNGELHYCNEKQNDNDNDNDNDVSYPDTYNDTLTYRSPPPPERAFRVIDYYGIKDAYNSLCPSLPAVKALSDARKKAIRARLNTYKEEDLLVAFRKAEQSDFLKGKNDRNWQATFDWILKDANMAKILDGNYDNREKKQSADPWNIDSNDIDDLAGIL